MKKATTVFLIPSRALFFIFIMKALRMMVDAVKLYKQNTVLILNSATDMHEHTVQTLIRLLLEGAV